MNWSRTKTWLIVLFVGINLFLIFTIVKENIAQSTVSEQMVENTIAVLERNGISIDSQIINRKMPLLSSVEVINTVSNQKECAEKILGGKVAYNAQNNQYMRSTSFVQFEGDSFSYFNINPAHSKVYETEQGAIDYATAFLTDAGFDMRKAEAKVYNYTKAETEVVFTQKLDKYPLLDSKIQIHVTANGISKATGCWFYMADDQSSSGSTGRITPVTSVLIDFISDPNRANTSTKITDITLGYTTGDKSTYHKSVSAMPSWCIKTADGMEYYYDAN